MLDEPRAPQTILSGYDCAAWFNGTRLEGLARASGPDVTRALQRAREAIEPPADGFDRLRTRFERRHRRNVVATVITVALLTAGSGTLAVLAFSDLEGRTATGARTEIAISLTTDPWATEAGRPMRSVVLVDAEGDVKEIAGGDADYFTPAWSPDGSSVAVVRLAQDEREADEAIYTIDVATGEARG
jgi:hypothetical protein